jgi:chemotaxis protein methyltransferase CheR
VNSTTFPLQVERFRGLVASRLGLQFEETRTAWLADVLCRRMKVLGLSAERYLERLCAAAARAEFGALAQELTVAETYFFRNIEQLRAMREHVVPERRRIGGAGHCLRVLSAGCASGEEPHSIAMMLRDVDADTARDLSIRAVDLNPAMIEKARQGRYGPWALRETPPAMRQRWFRSEGATLVLDDAIRGAVKFEQRNLGEDDAELWQAGAYDIVFCRNVLMYFTPQGAQALVERIAGAIAPGGYLFLGHAETLRGLSHAFHLRHTHGTFYYQRKDAIDPASPEWEASDTSPSPTPVVESSDSWVEAIDRSTDRVRALTEIPASAGASSASVAPHWHLGLALDLFRQERFTEVLGLVRTLPHETARDPDVMLLHALLLAHTDQLALAEDTCHRLLAIDELNAGAHYALALCREGVGDLGGAADNDQLAAYMDPTFAMPRMHLGLLARRAGNGEAVRREFGQAVKLLQSEDASRLLLFGGGFTREALLALCHAELKACGEVA